MAGVHYHFTFDDGDVLFGDCAGVTPPDGSNPWFILAHHDGNTQYVMIYSIRDALVRVLEP